MDFTPTESQQAVADLADRIMDDHLDMERHASIEAAGDWFDRNLWEDLAKAGLLQSFQLRLERKHFFLELFGGSPSRSCSAR